MERKKKVRLSDIAERLNVSTVTISKALANKEGVSDDLRKQIKDIAEEMGYKVKKSTPAANGTITGNIGILIPSRFFSQNMSFYWYLFNFLSQELLNRNYYSIMELLSDEDEEKLSPPRMLNDKKVDGLIILGQVSNAYINTIRTHYDNFILLDSYTNIMGIDCVCSDDYYCSYMLTSYVISQGHKKLRFVGNFDATSSIKDRFMGFQKALFENGLPVFEQCFLKALFENGLPVAFDEIIADRDEKGAQIELNLPSKENMPTAFICNNDETAAMIIEELQKRGYKVPEDISVTGFDNYIIRHANTIPLTTVYINPQDTANVAADLIIKKITGEPYIKGRHLVSGSLIIRDSVKNI